MCSSFFTPCILMENNLFEGDKIMSKQIYNEGRVVGLSQYEIFVKNWLSNTATKDIDPPSEQEWLASTVGPGNSLLLTMPANTAHNDDEIWIYETYLPEGSGLCGCNPIIASLFIGNGKLYENSGWSKYVSDYGDCITNTSTRHPSGEIPDPKDVPKGGKIYASEIPSIIEQYVKILDGVILQGGTWTYESTTEKSDFSPNFSSGNKSLLRVQIKGKITKPFSILFTGLNYKSTIQGVSGLDGSIDKAGYENGAYLGPAQYPWACKVMFTLPPAYTFAEDSKKHVYVVYGTGEEGEAEAKQVARSVGTNGLVIYRDTLYNDASALYSLVEDSTGEYQLYPLGAHASSNQIYIGNIVGTHFDSPSVPGVKIVNYDNNVYTTFNLPTVVGESGEPVPGFKVDPTRSRDVDYIRWSDLAQAMHDSIDEYQSRRYNSEADWKADIEGGQIYHWSSKFSIYSLLYEHPSGSIVDGSGARVIFDQNETYYKKSADSTQFKLDTLGPSLRETKHSLRSSAPYVNFNGTRLYVSQIEPSDGYHYEILSSQGAPSDWSTVTMKSEKYFAYRADGVYVPVGALEGSTTNYAVYKPNTYYQKVVDTIPDGSIGIGW